ncbi:MAG: hypothetical protein GPJ34_19540 [Microcystis aeruginosa LL11-07]|uniref:Uncharacterized protein n=1 Tax=Microcystis aeruginosa G11-04 TaxID=2685956 RepID=A0A966G1M1_MICAE|nr:hypothetical protein [Microcystis aeruginosa LL11-07]NCS53833.1 hypothetical protein [Microcystis aeruginosa G13-05]NCS58481.1 hypothetical protein [Microcystis aeruginosa G11-04]
MLPALTFLFQLKTLRSNLTPCHGQKAIAISSENGFLEETRFLDIVFWLRV